MDASELYRNGRLNEAIAAQISEVKARPGDIGRRLFLFELLLFAGEIERARRQLDAVRHDDPERDLATQDYRLLLDSESARRRFLTEGVAPEILGEPTDSLRLRIEATGMLRAGRPTEAKGLLDQANEAMPTAAGILNGKPFTSLRDADDLFAGVLEVMALGKYFWVGLEQVKGVGMTPPRFLRDLIYVPARLDLANESGEVFLPVLYPGSSTHADEQVRLGRLTDWVSSEESPTLGVGSRMFLVDEDAISLLEWRELIASDPSEPAD